MVGIDQRVVEDHRGRLPAFAQQFGERQPCQHRQLLAGADAEMPERLIHPVAPQVPELRHVGRQSQLARWEQGLQVGRHAPGDRLCERPPRLLLCLAQRVVQ